MAKAKHLRAGQEYKDRFGNVWELVDDGCSQWKLIDRKRMVEGAWLHGSGLKLIRDKKI